RVTRQAGEELLNLALLRAGDYFGEWSVLTGEPRAATVSAVTPVDAIRVDCQPFTEFLSEHPEIRAALDKVASDRRSKADKLVDSPDAMDKVVSNIQSLIDHSE
ncbi:MAG: cyclic nucleotide-binding domain-containing protein, partial [Thiohalophilus sp.]